MADATERRGIETIDGSNWQEFVASEAAVLMLASSTCPACAAWTEELEDYLEAHPGAFPRVRFGKILLDRPDLAEFRRANLWLVNEVEVVPYNVIYHQGRRVRGFAGGGIEELEQRLQRLTDAA
jgi:hypothetical protein